MRPHHGTVGLVHALLLEFSFFFAFLHFFAFTICDTWAWATLETFPHFFDSSSSLLFLDIASANLVVHTIKHWTV